MPRTASPRSSAESARDAARFRTLMSSSTRAAQRRQDLHDHAQARAASHFRDRQDPSEPCRSLMPKLVCPPRPKFADSIYRSGRWAQARRSGSPAIRLVYLKNDSTSRAREAAAGLAGRQGRQIDRWSGGISAPPGCETHCSPARSDYFRGADDRPCPLLRLLRTIKIVDTIARPAPYTFRLNHLQKKFDNPKVRQEFVGTPGPAGLDRRTSPSRILQALQGAVFAAARWAS